MSRRRRRRDDCKKKKAIGSCCQLLAVEFDVLFDVEAEIIDDSLDIEVLDIDDFDDLL